MKKILLIVLILTQFGIISFAEELTNFLYNSKQSTQKEIVSYSSINLSILEFGRGCCSHHGGVCGCSNGRALCCDGTLSPSCGCMNEKTIFSGNI